MTMISGQRCLVLGRVTEAGEFIEVSGNALRELVAKDAELSDILMRAFILRRFALISRGFGNVILMGSRHSAQTLQLRGFLTRNGHPYTYIDLDTDQTSQELLDRFEVKASEIPVVICNARTVLRNPSIQELAEVSRIQQQHRRRAGAGSDHRRSGSGGPRGSGLRSVGRPRCADD